MMLHALDPLLEKLVEWSEADRRVEMYVPNEARRQACQLLAERGFGDEPFAIIAPGGRSSRRWPARKFARLARDLGLPVLVEGSPEEWEILEKVAKQAGEARVVPAADPIPLFFALLERASLLVANDSGSIHLAEAARTPTLYFAHREKLIHSHPAGERCRALWDEVENRLSRITVRQALEAVAELTGRPRPVAHRRSVSPRR
jgi:ADP-heptose:LPS heptosyltransferase